MATSDELGWLAGLVDGEGCISLYHRKRYGGGWDYFFQISNTNPVIIKRVVEIAADVTGSMPYVRLDRVRGKRRPGFCVVVNSKRAIAALLTALRPYLIGKGPEADVLLYAIHNKFYRAVAAQQLRNLKKPSQANAEETLAGLRSLALRNDYGVTPKNNPRTSARPD